MFTMYLFVVTVMLLNLCDCYKYPYVCGPPGHSSAATVSPSRSRYRLHDNVTYECIAGEVVGNRYRTCVQSGSWSGSIPNCVVDGESDTCGRPDLPMNSFYNKTSSDEVTIYCVSGYDTMFSIINLCRDNTWILAREVIQDFKNMCRPRGCSRQDFADKYINVQFSDNATLLDQSLAVQGTLAYCGTYKVRKMCNDGQWTSTENDGRFPRPNRSNKRVDCVITAKHEYDATVMWITLGSVALIGSCAISILFKLN